MTDRAYIERVYLEDLTKQDLFWLTKATEASHDGTTAKELLEALARKTAAFWRLCGKADGLLVTKAYAEGDEKVIYIVAVAGKGYAQMLKKVADALKDHANEIGAARKIRGFVADSKLANVYIRRMKAKPVTTLYEMEL